MRSGRRIERGCLIETLAPEHPACAQLLLLPGSAHGGWCYRFWSPAFAARGFATHALTRPGIGEAPPLDEAAFRARSTAEEAAMIADILAALPRPRVLLGHSPGGILAQLAATRAACEALVLVASSGPSQLAVRRRVLLPMDRPVPPGTGRARRDWYAEAEPAIRDWAIARLSPESPGVLNGAAGRAELDPAAITCPVLVLSGGRDRSIVPPGPELAALYGATHRHFPAAGHVPMLEPVALDMARSTWRARHGALDMARAILASLDGALGTQAAAGSAREASASSR
jgi:pimeloyl-ACP methyl ester carboxylesterase